MALSGSQMEPSKTSLQEFEETTCGSNSAINMAERSKEFPTFPFNGSHKNGLFSEELVPLSLADKLREFSFEKSTSEDEFIEREADRGNFYIPQNMSITSAVNSPDSNDSGIQDDDYRAKRLASLDDISSVINGQKSESFQPERKTSQKDDLPPGWKEDKDSTGPYYWHIKSGTIQRYHPAHNDHKSPKKLTMLEYYQRNFERFRETPDSSTTSESRSNKDSQPNLWNFSLPSPEKNSELPSSNLFYKESGSPDIRKPGVEQGSSNCARIERKEDRPPLRFLVCAMGWRKLQDEDIAPDQYSATVNRCIVDIASAAEKRFKSNGDGNSRVRKLYLELRNQKLILVEPRNFAVLHKQPIVGIKVWGVGQDNERDFAYVARDPATRQYICHVFRCDVPATFLANTLCGQCGRLITERRARSQPQPCIQQRPKSLPDFGQLPTYKSNPALVSLCGERNGFPLVTPTLEAKKYIPCSYIGSIPVSQPTGIEILNDAIDSLQKSFPKDGWLSVNAGITPSTITISEIRPPEVTLIECRVRFLTFMGIAKTNQSLCGFIVHTAENRYVCHVLHCDPSAGNFCKTIQAACTLRFQKCLDSSITAAQYAPDKTKRNLYCKLKSDDRIACEDNGTITCLFNILHWK